MQGLVLSPSSFFLLCPCLFHLASLIPSFCSQTHPSCSLVLAPFSWNGRFILIHRSCFNPRCARLYRHKKDTPPHPTPEVATCPPRDKGHLCVRDTIQTQGWRVKDAGLQNLKQGWVRPRELCGSKPGVGKLASRPNLACHLFS